jgi:rSAM/selenodomain-associated transferase 1
MCFCWAMRKRRFSILGAYVNGILIIMAKQPLYGAVKTRLCPPLTPEEALILYEAFVLDTISLVDEACMLAGNVTPALAYSPQGSHDYFLNHVPERFVLLPQIGDDLGERLSNLPVQARTLGFASTAMISSDSPTLAPNVVARCFEELARPGADVVLGPCTDGGYYLIGMNEPQPALFRGITWSTEHVMRQTLAAAAHAALNVRLLSAWYDTDTPEDLRRLWADLELDNSRAPHTHKVLSGPLSYLFAQVGT